MAPQRRESLLTDVIGMAVGVGMIGVAYSRQFNAIAYPSGDSRGDPSVQAAIAIAGTVAGLIAFLLASIRLIQGLRARGR